MQSSRKYGRTYHFPFSPGTTSDDRVQHQYWTQLQQMQQIVITEKLDGENNCLSRHGVFARSHAAPTTSPWTNRLRMRWEKIRDALGDLEIFGENLYAIHSIAYQNLEDYFFVFAIRHLDYWLDWEEVCFYAAALELPVVPVIEIGAPPTGADVFRSQIVALAKEESVFGSIDHATGQPCTREGLVVRDFDGFAADKLHEHVFKYVRPNHVKTDAHWTQNWQRAHLNQY